jgi:FkbM family methyltransferase
MRRYRPNYQTNSHLPTIPQSVIINNSARPAQVSGWPIFFDETTLAPGAEGWRLNPAILRYKDGYVFAYRAKPRAGSTIWIMRLDQNFRPIGQPHRLALKQEEAPYSCEDPRLFMFGGKLHINYSATHGEFGPSSVFYARLNDNLCVEELFAPKYHRRNSWEKNWQFFEHANKLLAVYSILPHKILEIHGNVVTEACETPVLPHWNGGELRGGTPPVRIGHEYHSFFHSRSYRYGALFYDAGLYTFAAEPPFMVQRMTPFPVMSGDARTRPVPTSAPIVFPLGAVYDDEYCYVSMGVHDRWSEIRRYRRDDLESKLRRIGTPPWWRWRGNMTEPSMYASIHSHDEYSLLTTDLKGANVIDAGAHVGTFTHFALTRGAKYVHAYEPHPASFDLLRYNTGYMLWAEGGYPNSRITIHEEAVGGNPGRGYNCTASTESMGNIVYNDGEGPVKIVPLDEVIRRAVAYGPIRLLKIDIEGGEWAAFESVKDLSAVEIISGEYHRDYYGVSRMRTLLEPHGFKVTGPKPAEGGYGMFRAERIKK